MADIFEKPKAPFYKWGTRLTMQEIAYEEYYAYIRERFPQNLQSTPDAVLKYLQDSLMRSPEEIHRICYEIQKRNISGHLDQALIEKIINDHVDGYTDIFEARLDALAPNQVSFLKQISFSPDRRAENVYSKSFLQKVGVTASGMLKIVRKLLDRGLIDKREGFYYMVDPFLAYHLRNTRLP